MKLGDSFQFETKGSRGGTITVGDTSGAPLTTNAKGVATNFNADQLDGKDATYFASADDLEPLAKAGDLKFAVVSAGATITSGRGATSASVAATTYTVTFDANVSRCSYTATPAANSTNTLAVESGTDPATVVVTQSAGPTGFHLQVIC